MPLPKIKKKSLPPLRPSGMAQEGWGWLGSVKIKKSIAKTIQLLISNFVCIILYYPSSKKQICPCLRATSGMARPPHLKGQHSEKIQIGGKFSINPSVGVKIFCK